MYDYIWDEQSEGNEINREVTRHITIHTLHLDGMRQLYRHFLVLPGKFYFSGVLKLNQNNLFLSVEFSVILTLAEYYLYI